MKNLFIFCAVCCFATGLNLPAEYFAFLRILVCVTSVLTIYRFLDAENYFWIVTFSLVFVVFNPLHPTYLYRESIRVHLYMLTGILFLINYFKKEIAKNKEESNTIKKENS